MSTLISKDFYKKAVFFIAYYVITVLISIFFGYWQTHNVQTEEAKIKNEWYELSGDLDSNNSLTEFEQKMTSKLRKIAEIISEKNNHNQKSFEERIADCANTSTSRITYPVKWEAYKISVPIEQVNYNYVCKIQPFTSSPQLASQQKNTQIFDSFVEVISNDIINSDIVKLDKKNSNNSLKDYSDKFIKFFTKNNNTQDIDYSEKFPSLRAMWIYIANSNGEMLYYPARETKLSLDNHVLERPWWKIASKKADKPLNITPPYADVSDNLQNTNIIRTVWYNFDINNIKYVLCVDLFFDSTQNINESSLLEQYIKSGSIIKQDDILPSFFIQSLVLSLLLFFCSQLSSKYFSSKKSAPSEFVNLKLQRYKIDYASKDGSRSIDFIVEGKTKQINRSAKSIEAGWKLESSVLTSNKKNTLENSKESEESYTYKSSGSYDLDMIKKQPPYRCIEIWEIVLESKHNIKKLGFLVASWNTTNSTNPVEELDIKSIIWEKEYEENLDIVKEQLRDHLLISEEESFVGLLEYSNKRRINIPQYLSGIDFIQKIIDNSLYLDQRKVVVPEIEIITEIYKLGIVQAICTRNFLQILVERNKMEELFALSVQERFYIEHEEDEFKKFFDLLDDKYKSFLENISSFKIMVYDKSKDNIVKSEDDFCIVKINNKPSIVAYTLTDNRYLNAGGWISWRDVDIRYYTELYQCQINKGHRIETVNAYLIRTHSI